MPTVRDDNGAGRQGTYRPPLSLPYIAGLFDGEGCVGIYNPYRNFWCLRVIFSLQQGKLLAKIQKRWGGAVNYNITTGTYHLTLTGDKAKQMLEDLLPYLQVKYTQALVAIEYQEQRPSGRNNVDVVEHTNLAEPLQTKIREIRESAEYRQRI